MKGKGSITTVNVTVEGEANKVNVTVAPWRIEIRAGKGKKISWILNDPQGLTQGKLGVHNAGKLAPGEPNLPDEGPLHGQVSHGPFETATPAGHWCQYNIEIPMKDDEDITIDPDYRVDPP